MKSELYDIQENEYPESAEKECWYRNQRSLETSKEILDRLEYVGVEQIRLDGLQERFQNEIVCCIEKMYENFPQLNGYISKIVSVNLQDGVLACSGPRFEGNVYKGAEVQFNKNFFKNKHYSLDIVNLESDFNWKGESWLAGKGGEGVVAHEIGHVMALQMNARGVGLELDEQNSHKKKELQEHYMRNYDTNQICMQALRELGISVNNIGTELSVYGAHDMGEMFAECVSEVQTRKHPRRLSQKVMEIYNSRKAV